MLRNSTVMILALMAGLGAGTAHADSSDYRLLTCHSTGLILQHVVLGAGLSLQQTPQGGINVNATELLDGDDSFVGGYRTQIKTGPLQITGQGLCEATKILDNATAYAKAKALQNPACSSTGSTGSTGGCQ